MRREGISPWDLKGRVFGMIIPAGMVSEEMIPDRASRIMIGFLHRRFLQSGTQTSGQGAEFFKNGLRALCRVR